MHLVSPPSLGLVIDTEGEIDPDAADEAVGVEEALAECLDRICSLQSGRSATLQCRDIYGILIALFRRQQSPSSLSALSVIEYLSREPSFLRVFHASGSLSINRINTVALRELTFIGWVTDLAAPLLAHARDMRALQSLLRVAISSRANRNAIVDAGASAILVPLMRDDTIVAEAQVLCVQNFLFLIRHNRSCRAQ